MARGRVDSVSEPTTTQKSTVYLLDSFHPEASKHAQTLFDTILPTDLRNSQWREKAEYLLIQGSYLTAEDIKSCQNFKALAKQGVAMYVLHRLKCLWLTVGGYRQD